jgi:hypothetical protein
MFMEKSTLEVILDGRRDINRSYIPVDLLPRLPPFALNFSQLPVFTFSNDTLVSDAMNQLESIRDLSGVTRSWTRVRVSDRLALIDSAGKNELFVLGLIDGRTLMIKSPEQLAERIEADPKEEEVVIDELTQLSDSISELLLNDKIRVLTHHISSFPRQELGFLAGVSYIIGDVNTLGVIPSALDFALTGMYTYLLDERWSFGGRYQFTRVATGYGSLLPIIDGKNETVFRNDLHSFRAESFYSLWPRKQGKTVYGYLTGEVGIGLGLLFFDPKMRGVDLEGEGRWIRARPYGTEGQNFLEGENAYGYVALDLTFAGRLRWMIGDLSLFLEGALSVASTDYLDDMSDGYYYGGNIGEYRNTPPSNVGFTDPGGQGRGEINRLQESTGRKNPKVTRGYNALPDAYVAFQVGFAYTID